MSTSTLTRTAPAVAPAAAGVDPACTAERHGSQRAYRDGGCRCPSAVAAHERYRARERERRLVWRKDRHPDVVAAQAEADLKQAAAAVRQAERALHLATGERERYRGPSRVSRTAVSLLMIGFRDQPTIAEQWLVAQRLAAYGWEVEEIALHLRVRSGTLGWHREKIRRLAAERAKRRLADVRWKAARVALIEARRVERELAGR